VSVISNTEILPMTPSEAKRYLNSFVNYEKSLHNIRGNTFTLERIKYVLALLGNPQEKYKIIHVAGSKGKGSVSSMIATILDQDGFHVGLYTSPHLYDFKERIRILRVPYRSKKKNELFSDTISERDLAKIIQVIKPHIEKVKKENGALTYFEVTTVIALYYFAKKNADFAVLETGLGGRLDATNAVESMIAVITPIELEHTNILGSTLEKIAGEKAGIIKNAKQSVVIAPQHSSVLAVLKKHCRKFFIQPVTIKNPAVEISFQITNVETVKSVLGCLKKKGFPISSNAISSGIKKRFWPGRFEVLQTKPVIILDGAHTIESCAILARTIKKIFKNKKITLIFGTSQDKDIKSMAHILEPLAQFVIGTVASHPRAYVFNRRKLKGFFPRKLTFLAPNVKSAVQLAQRLTKKEDVIVVTGSLFVAGEARRYVSI
jgi:dihydrofolate synthase/folylpolyglutamate synthase